MAFSYSDVKVYYDDLKPQIKAILTELDDMFIRGRDEEDVPIYLTKTRIKSLDSCYLKTKRKADITGLSDITDFAGLRVLCLFEKDIYAVHDHLLGFLKKKGNGFRLNEFTIYNWSDKPGSDDLLESTRTAFPSSECSDKPKLSGYKSLHYLVDKLHGEKRLVVEIQLRTLLQDVWGELEHSLSYKKGGIHPHIKKSFQLLSSDLSNNDKLISHLKDISDKEESSFCYYNDLARPRNRFEYEPRRLPEIFQEGPNIPLKYEAYVKAFQPGKALQLYSRSEINAIKKAYNDLVRGVTLNQKRNRKLNYWIEMEEAFLLFLEGKHSAALKKYEELENSYPKSYVLQFRKGELYLHQRNIEKALAAFDESEELLKGEKEGNLVNRYRIKLSIALSYWMTGEEYIDIALREIEEAWSIFKANRGMFDRRDEVVLLNNRCWYYLDKFEISKKKKYFRTAKSAFKALEGFIDDNSTSNIFDTAAWFCYQSYRLTKDKNYLRRAKEYCVRMRDKINYTTYNQLSMKMQSNHIQEIMHSK